MDFQTYVGLHKNRTENDVRFVPESWFEEHTMQDALFNYVVQKLPVQNIRDAMVKGTPIELHGTHPTKAKETFEALGYDDVQQIPHRHNPNPKKFNYVRPAFFTAKQGKRDVLLAAVSAGESYLTNFAEMVRYFMLDQKGDPYTQMKVMRYPDLEAGLVDWTHLDAAFVKKDDRVVIGYVQEIEDRITKKNNLKLLGEEENDFYVSRRYEIPGSKPVNFLGVKFTFWGDISARIAEGACAQGAEEIIYVSKVGALSNPDDLYERMYAPSSFYLLRHDQVTHQTKSVENSILKTTPALDSGAHVTVHTVMEESFTQRDLAKALGANSIDDENALITQVIEQHNARTGVNVRFSSIHFATDFLYDRDQEFNHDQLNLSNNRTQKAVQGKKKMLDEMAVEVEKHIGINDNNPPGLKAAQLPQTGTGGPSKPPGVDI